MRSDRNRATLLRGGTCLYPGLAADKSWRDPPLCRGANWLRRDAAPSVRMDDNTLATAASVALELESWAWTPIDPRTQVSAQLIGQFGGGERGYGGMLNLSHAW